MKKFIIAPVAAVVMLGVSGVASAQAEVDYNGTSVEISKKVDITNAIDYKGKAAILGAVNINQLGMAVISNKQQSHDNSVLNIRNTNNANIDGGSGNDLAGNSGVNVAGGDNNVQANNTALTALGATPNSFLGAGASVDAEIASKQLATLNQTDNQGNRNNAGIDDGSLTGSDGNLGANVASGSGNVQANNFAVSYGESANLAVSTVDNHQVVTNNATRNETLMQKEEGFTIGISMSGDVNGTYQGDSVQSNNVYPEIWQGGSEDVNHQIPGPGIYWGHADFDGAPGTGGDKPSSGQDAHFEFAEEGTIDLGNVSLAGAMTTVNTIVGRTNVNNAVLSGGSLNNAAGNVGVNVAAGTNNLQGNSLALSAVNF